MTTIIKLIIASILALLMTSCNIDFGVDGNGDVTTFERTINGTYDEIEISNGLDVYLTQSDTESIAVQADDNLHDIIITKIEGNVLKIYADENIRSSKAQKVIVSFSNISKISASSGSDVYSKNTLNLDDLNIATSSGSDVKLDVNSTTIESSTASGSYLKLSGTTQTFIAEAASGSVINASDLNAETSRVRASSGADITVNTSKELFAKAHSGGDIRYSGNPLKVEKSDNVSGNISQR